MSFAEVVKFKGAPIYVRGYYKSTEKSHDASVSRRSPKFTSIRDRR